MDLTGKITYPVFAEMAQLGFTNPAAIAWEITPFSFVFDWFYQVGDYLNALSVLSGFEFITYRWSALTIFEGASSSTITPGWRFNVWWDTVAPCESQWTARLYQRSGNSAVDIGTLAGLRPMQGGGVNGLRRFASAIALFRGNAGRLFRT
jgi:hypothetical protein